MMLIVLVAIVVIGNVVTGGNVDLAVGSIVALVGAFAGTFIITWGWNTYLSVLLCLVLLAAVAFDVISKQKIKK